EKFLRRTAVAGVDELADICLAASDDAAEGRDNVFETLEFFKAADVGLRGIYRGLFSGEIADSVVHLLLGDAVGLDEFLKARGRNLGEIRVGLRGGKVGLGLRKLLIYFGSVNIRKQLALSDTAANVVVPLFYVAAGARVDGRFNVSLH